jgi:hypothetical protein
MRAAALFPHARTLRAVPLLFLDEKSTTTWRSAGDAAGSVASLRCEPALLALAQLGPSCSAVL